MENTTLSESFEVLKDPRLERAKRHSLINIITIAICAVICGADNFVSMASFGRATPCRRKVFRVTAKKDQASRSFLIL